MSPRSSAQFEEMREEKKTLIMNTALEHFSDYGFHATTISHIAKHAGISKGLMYNYFKSKEDLLAAIINRSLDEIYNNFNPDRDNNLTPDEFENFIRRIFAIFRENRQFWKLIYRVMLQRGCTNTFQMIRTLHSQWEECLLWSIQHTWGTCFLTISAGKRRRKGLIMIR